VEDAVRGPVTTWQLQLRAEVALHAAVGLEPDKRAQVEEVLINKLQDPDLPEAQRTDLAVVAAMLGDLSARASGEVARTLSPAPTNDYVDQRNMAIGLAAVAARLEPPQAADALLQAMTKTSDRSTLQSMASGLAVVLIRVDRAELSRRSTAVAATLGHLGSSGHVATILPHLRTVVEPLPCRFSTPELVEFLKQPTCVGPARRVILDQLENRYGRKFIDQWEFVRFAQEQGLGLDFTSPPQRFALETRKPEP
jgi:hypothetical protein